MTDVIQGIKFAGCSVIAYSGSGGLNNEAGQTDVQLVEVLSSGDRFTRPNAGSYQTFTHDGLIYNGIVQKWDYKEGLDGLLYTVTIMDPREILGGCEVVLASYRGQTLGVPNLFNVYGYWEDALGFGGANTNESGMLWNATFDILGLDSSFTGFHINKVDRVGIRPALEAMFTKPNKFGGQINFAGSLYTIDFTTLPDAPSYYRMGGVNITLLDAINQLCQDAGCDYYVYLDKYVIKFKIVSRVQQPQLGTIANYIRSSKIANQRSTGIELRNDITNAFLVGGDFNYLVQEFNPGGGDAIVPFWGFDFNNQLIIGQGTIDNLKITSASNNTADNPINVNNPFGGNNNPFGGSTNPFGGSDTPFNDPSANPYTFNLNASQISGVIGDVFYPCDLNELRCALIDYDSWAAYVIGVYPAKADAINLIGAVDSDQYNNLVDLFGDCIIQRDLQDFSDRTAKGFGEMNESTYWADRAQLIYNFVQGYASEYFGKKFLVRVPFQIYWKYEPETTHIVSSDEPSDAGYQGEGTAPIGIGFLEEGMFLTQDGRYECFVKISNFSGVDLERLSPDFAIVSNGALYIKATVDNNIGIVYPPNSIYPCVVIELASQIFAKPETPLGNISDIAAILGLPSQSNLDIAIGIRHGSFPLRIHPAPYRPDAVALPMKSNRDSYGPWQSAPGIPGKVSFQKDDGLVPWNYGGYDIMNQAALAKLANIATYMQSGEIGTLTEVGSPKVSLGDVLVAGGPNVSNISVSIGLNGLMTTYSMRTFSPLYRTFSKENADRLRRLGLAAQDTRRATRQLFLSSQQSRQVLNAAYIGFFQNASRAISQRTPHDVLVSTVTQSTNFGIRTQVSAQTIQEAVACVRADRDDYYTSSAAMSMEGLLRPFSTKVISDVDETSFMPIYPQVIDATGLSHYSSLPTGIIPMDDSLASRFSLDIFGDKNDIDILAWGDTYPTVDQDNRDKKNRKKFTGLHTKKGQPEYDNMRPLALRGPIMINGFGYEVSGKPIPNMSPIGTVDKWSNMFATGYRESPEKWAVGPLDLDFDIWRGVWGVPGVMMAVTSRQWRSTGGYVKFKCDWHPDGFLPDEVIVDDWLGAGNYASGIHMAVTKHRLENKWYVIAVACN